MSSSGHFGTIADYAHEARRAMPSATFDTMFGTPDSPMGKANQRNLSAFDAVALRPRVLVDKRERKLETQVLGQETNLPVMLAPVGNHQRAHPAGELASAGAAGDAGIVMVVSGNASYTLEEIASASKGPLWFQIYLFKDRGLTEILVRRAEEAGYTGLVVTVDNVGVRSRERDQEYFYTLRDDTALRNLDGIDRPNLPDKETFFQSMELDLRWSSIEWLRSITSMPIIIKGIQAAEDARVCVENGADALVVSNHGGHAFTHIPGSAEVLPEVVEVAGGRLEIYVDGGIRTGADVLKSLALGAKAVLIGRPIFWGLAVNGESGLRHELEILRHELDVAMSLCGVADVSAVDQTLIWNSSGG